MASGQAVARLPALTRLLRLHARVLLAHTPARGPTPTRTPPSALADAAGWGDGGGRGAGDWQAGAAVPDLRSHGGQRHLECALAGRGGAAFDGGSRGGDVPTRRCGAPPPTHPPRSTRPPPPRPRPPVVHAAWHERFKGVRTLIIAPRELEKRDIARGALTSPYQYDREPFRVRAKDFWPLCKAHSLIHKFIPSLSHEAGARVGHAPRPVLCAPRPRRPLSRLRPCRLSGTAPLSAPPPAPRHSPPPPPPPAPHPPPCRWAHPAGVRGALCARHLPRAAEVEVCAPQLCGLSPLAAPGQHGPPAAAAGDAAQHGTGLQGAGG